MIARRVGVKRNPTLVFKRKTRVSCESLIAVRTTTNRQNKIKNIKCEAVDRPRLCTSGAGFMFTYERKREG